MTKKAIIGLSVSAGVLLVGFLVIAIVLSVNGMNPLAIDTAIAQWAYGIRGEEGGVVYWFFRIVTELGYTYCTVAIILLLGIFWKFKAKTWFLAGGVVFCLVLQKILKAIFDRPRPDMDMWWMAESSSSFPSGHSMNVVCLFVLVAYFVLSNPQVKLWLKCVVASIGAFAIMMVPFSRIILGVHYFTDVLAGMMIGAVVAIMTIFVYNFVMAKLNKRKGKGASLTEIQPIKDK